MRITGMAVVAVTVAIIGGCAANSGPPAHHTSPAPVASSAPVVTPAPEPTHSDVALTVCDRIVAWRETGGVKPLSQVLRVLDLMHRDGNLGDLAGVKADALLLIGAATRAGQRPMPGHATQWRQMVANFVAAGQAIGQNRIADAAVLIRAAGSNATDITNAIRVCT